LEPSREHPHVPGPSLWPVGFALGIVVLLVGFVVWPPIVFIGGAIALTFAGLWIRDVVRGTDLTEAPAVEPERREPRAPVPAAPKAALSDYRPHDKVTRPIFLELSTIGLGQVIGAAVTLPVLGFMIGPAFLKQGVKHHDLGPISDYPEGKFMVTTFTSDPAEGVVSRRTAFVRNNGMIGKLPSFTIISNHCAHLGCPVQPNGLPDTKGAVHYKDVTMLPVSPSGFGCPCHGGQYDTEGNRTAGPPVRALDRYSFSIINAHLFVGKPFSVARVEGTGASAKIHETTYSFPGEHVDGLESWLYPIQPPH